MMQPQINHATGLHHVLPGNDTENDFIWGYTFDSYLGDSMILTFHVPPLSTMRYRKFIDYKL